MLPSATRSSARRTGRRTAAGRLLACAFVAGAVGFEGELSAQSRGIRFDRLAQEQGLSQATVTCILQDRVGFLWFGTQDGLNRFDGYGFEVFKTDAADPTTLPADLILALHEDASGNLWIGTDGGGLARWQGQGAFDRYQHDPEDAGSLAGNRVRALHFDRQGGLWVGTAESGLDRLDLQSGRFEHFRHDPTDPASLSDDRVRTIYQSRDGALWIGTLGGLNRYDPSAGAFVRYRHDPSDPASLSDDGVLSILEDQAGALWVGTENGLNRLNRGSGAASAYQDGSAFVRLQHDPSDPASLGQNRVRALLEDAERRLWVGTDAGLSLRESPGSGFANYRNDPGDPASLGAERVMSIFQDRGNVLWVGTQGGGVSKWNPATWAFSHYRADPSGGGPDGGGRSGSGLTSNTVYAFSEDPQGRLWIGTFGGGINVLEREAGRPARFTHYRHDPGDPTSLPDDRIASLLHDRSGTLWVGTLTRGLSRLDASSGAFTHFRHDPERPESLAHDVLSPLFEDRQGTLWIGTFGGGLDRFDPATETFIHHRHDPQDPASLSNDRVMSLVEDAGGFLWVGTDGGGLNRLDRASGRIVRFQSEPQDPASLTNDTVLTLHIDASGSLWAGTLVGLHRLERLDMAAEQASFRHYYERDGLPNDTVYGIESDQRGRLWLSTNGGLGRFDPATDEFESFNRSHGLQSDEFNFNAHFRSRSGELFFGGVGGFNAFFPERIEANPHVPPVVLTSFTRLNRPVRFDRPLSEVEEIPLDYRDYFFAFEVAALDFAAPEQNRYRYKLEGLDTDWVDLGPRRRMTFTNLDAGNYVLRVQGSNNDGVWNQQGARVAIRVAPPPWKTWWAYTLYALALAAVIAWSVLHHHLKVERERSIARRERRIARRERAQSEERRRLLEEHETLIEELEAKNTELERFNYTVSHDLKSPLVTIKGFLGLLEKDAASGEADRLKRDVRRIAAAADRMGRLLDELLELSRVGRMVRPPEEVALYQLVRDALELVRGHAGTRPVDVLIDPALPVVFGDRLRLQQLYQNLIANAFKYMGEQKAPTVEIGMRRGLPADPEGVDPDDEVLFVTDNGIGIEARYHEKVFGLFERLDATETDGTGIGLALAKRIVELHGGLIWVESEGRGCGSTFCFTLPDPRGNGGIEPDESGIIVDARNRFRKLSSVD